ncbi:hypothetical protein RFI_23266 [Reticulomyxa filosa]|uniref:Uncharacterized protein n=1 Tax=Reticulomyxa filosa TaxID=46433 RepID=X6MLY6_RETFI|nr:hypothetical protein RFI_23266 [Reticulomyxa filosa]|eukprot:ETO14100.1 hypothetical protein RFI_23266 [Reticulomyxa filosa]
MLFEPLGTKMIKKAVSQMYAIELRKGERIICKGKPNQAFFVVEKGRLRGDVDDPSTNTDTNSNTNASANKREYEYYQRKDTFGESALLCGEQPNCTIDALDSCRVWALDADVFMQIKKMRTEKLRMLQSISPFKKCTVEQLQIICDHLRCFTYWRGDKITTEGENATFFQIIVCGEAKGLKYNSKKCKEVVVQKYEAKDGGSPLYFGDKEIKCDSAHELTVKVTSDTLKCHALPITVFKQIMDELEEEEKDIDVNGHGSSGSRDKINIDEKKLTDNGEGSVTGSLREVTPEPKCDPLSKFVNRVNCSLNDLKQIGILGSGAFGTVSLVEDVTTGTTYSLKKIRKNKVVDCAQEKHVLNERQILGSLDNNFCVKLYATYKDALNVYLLLEPILGGELFYVLRYNKRFKEPVARFFASCVVCAFEYIHKKNLIFRDLKLENLLVASNGYCKLIDFGFAKVQNELHSLLLKE